LQLANHL